MYSGIAAQKEGKEINNMFTEMMGAGGGSGKIFTKEVPVTYVAGTNTLTFSDFTEIYAIRLASGNYVTAYIDENGNLQNSGGYAGAMTVTNILGNVVTASVASGFEGNNTCIVTGKQ